MFKLAGSDRGLREQQRYAVEVWKRQLELELVSELCEYAKREGGQTVHCASPAVGQFLVRRPADHAVFAFCSAHEGALSFDMFLAGFETLWRVDLVDGVWMV